MLGIQLLCESWRRRRLPFALSAIALFLALAIPLIARTAFPGLAVDVKFSSDLLGIVSPSNEPLFVHNSDPWGNPWRSDSKGFYSAGANGRCEGREGDDIMLSAKHYPKLAYALPWLSDGILLLSLFFAWFAVCPAVRVQRGERLRGVMAWIGTGLTPLLLALWPEGRRIWVELIDLLGVTHGDPTLSFTLSLGFASALATIYLWRKQSEGKPDPVLFQNSDEGK